MLPAFAKSKQAGTTEEEQSNKNRKQKELRTYAINK